MLQYFTTLDQEFYIMRVYLRRCYYIIPTILEKNHTEKSCKMSIAIYLYLIIYGRNTQ